MSAFQKWFEAQHGERPGSRVYANTSDAELRAIRDEGLRAQEILDRRKIYDARRDSALYAWQARERDAHEDRERNSDIAAGLQQEVERLRWLISDGEKHFGSLWRQATTADIETIRGTPNGTP